MRSSAAPPTVEKTDTDNPVRHAATPRTRGIARRESILEAAVRLFAKRGFRATGIIPLAQEVGLSHVGLLHHFGTKEDLLRAVVARRESEEEEEARGAPAPVGVAALKALAKRGHQLVANSLHPRLYTVLIAENLDAGDPLHDYFVDRYRRVRGSISQSIREGQRCGEIRPDVDADRIAAEILSFIVGTQIQWLLDPDSIDVNGAYERYLGRLIDDIALGRERESRRR
jgi:AcrR family transcriptional regulator